MMSRIESGWEDVDYGDGTIGVNLIHSPNETYSVGYRYGSNTEDGHVLILKGGNVCTHMRIPEPRSADISNTGRATFVDWVSYGENTGSILSVVNEADEEVFRLQSEKSAGLTSISPDGNYVAFCPYDGKSHIFDVENGNRLTIHLNQLGDRQVPLFTSNGGDLELQFLREGEEAPLYAISVDGEVLWADDRLSNYQYYETITLGEGTDWEHELPELFDDYHDTSDPVIREEIAQTIGEARLTDIDKPSVFQTIAETLASNFDPISNEDHQRQIAIKTGDSYYRLAKFHQDKTKVTQEFWRAMEQADYFFAKGLPLYDAKDGMARVRRVLGKTYLNTGDIDAAYSCYKAIKELEDWANVNLLTDADRRRLSEAKERGGSQTDLPHCQTPSRCEVTWE